MSTYTDCLALGQYDNNECGITEKGRIRSIALVKKGISITNPSDFSEWQTLETNSAGQTTPDLVVIRGCRGSKTDTPTEGPGFGNTPSDVQGWLFEFLIVDENVSTQNVTFYNNMKRLAKNYRLWYVTESLLWQTEGIISLANALPVTDDVTGNINWNITIKISQEDQPVAYGAPGDFFEEE